MNKSKLGTKNGSFFLNDKGQTEKVKVFQFAVYSWLIFHSFLILPISHEIVSAFVFENIETNSLDLLVAKFATFIPLSPQSLLKFLIWTQIGLCAANLVGFLPLTTSFLVLVVEMVIDTIAFSVMDGGNNLITQVLFFNLCLSLGVFLKRFRPRFVEVGGVFEKFGILSIQMQLCLVYLSSAIFKITGELWQNGTALHYVSQVDLFSHPYIEVFFVNHPTFSAIGTYAVIAFQLLFPFGIWIEKARPFFMLLAIVFHLGTLFIMGITSFALAMCVVVLVFHSQDTALFIYKLNKAFLGGTVSFFDSDCKICSKTSAFFKRIDVFQNTEGSRLGDCVLQ